MSSDSHSRHPHSSRSGSGGSGSPSGASGERPFPPFYGANSPLAPGDSLLLTAPHLRPVALPDVLNGASAQTPPTNVIGNVEDYMWRHPINDPHGFSVNQPRLAGPVNPPTHGHSRRTASNPIDPERVRKVFESGHMSMAAIGSPSSPVAHPYVRTTSFGYALLIYDVRFPPKLTGSHRIEHASMKNFANEDLHYPAFDPPLTSLRCPVRLYFVPDVNTDQWVQLPWTITISAPRRTTIPAPGQMPKITIYDVFLSIYSSLLTPVEENELTRFHPAQLQDASAARSRRLQPGANEGSTALSCIRSDFLRDCYNFAGFQRLSDGTIIVRISP